MKKAPILLIEVSWKDGNEIILILQKLNECMDCCCCCFQLDTCTGKRLLHLHPDCQAILGLFGLQAVDKHTGRQVWTVSNGDFKGRPTSSLSYYTALFQEEHFLPAYLLQQSPSGSRTKRSLLWLLVSEIILSATCNY